MFAGPIGVALAIGRAGRRINVRAFVAAALLPFALAAGAAPERITESCNTVLYGDGNVLLWVTNPANFLPIVADPASDPDIYYRLWLPQSARALAVGPVQIVVLSYDPVQDGAQIAREIAADPVLQSRGVTSTEADGGGLCFATAPPQPIVTVTEYHNTILDHYFLSSTPEENAIIDAGGAGPGWERTGESFSATLPDGCTDASRWVWRFYAPPPTNSHFFTVDPGECGFLRNHDPGWIYEGRAFGADLPVDGACPASRRPVYRLYNNRWMFGDSNHRYTVKPEVYQAMIDQGWAGEGVAMCVLPAPSLRALR